MRLCSEPILLPQVSGKLTPLQNFAFEKVVDQVALNGRCDLDQLYRNFGNPTSMLQALAELERLRLITMSDAGFVLLARQD